MIEITSYDQKGLVKRLRQIETNNYIMGLYMPFALNDIHEIYNRDQMSKQDHDSHRQLSYAMYDMHLKHLSASKPATYICSLGYDSVNIINL